MRQNKTNIILLSLILVVLIIGFLGRISLVSALECSGTCWSKGAEKCRCSTGMGSGWKNTGKSCKWYPGTHYSAWGSLRCDSSGNAYHTRQIKTCTQCGTRETAGDYGDGCSRYTTTTETEYLPNRNTECCTPQCNPPLCGQEDNCGGNCETDSVGTGYKNSCDNTDVCGQTRNTRNFNSCDLTTNTSCGSETFCSDDLDNDCDGKTDYEDDDCIPQTLSKHWLDMNNKVIDDETIDKNDSVKLQMEFNYTLANEQDLKNNVQFKLVKKSIIIPILNISNVDLLFSWPFKGQKEFWYAQSFKRLGRRGNYTFSYLYNNELVSGSLSHSILVSNTINDTPLKIELLSPECGLTSETSKNVSFIVNVSDEDDPIEGNITYNNTLIGNITNGLYKYNYSFSTPGEYQIVVTAKSPRESSAKYLFSNIIIYKNSTDGNYTAACIDSPQEGESFGVGYIPFTAISTNGVSCSGGSCRFENHSSQHLLYNWSFPFEKNGMPNLVLNGSGKNGLNPYNFSAFFINAGYHRAVLRVDYI